MFEFLFNSVILGILIIHEYLRWDGCIRDATHRNHDRVNIGVYSMVGGVGGP